jgi:hypothetical protein
MPRSCTEIFLTVFSLMWISSASILQVNRASYHTCSLIFEILSSVLSAFSKSFVPLNNITVAQSRFTVNCL